MRDSLRVELAKNAYVLGDVLSGEVLFQVISEPFEASAPYQPETFTYRFFFKLPLKIHESLSVATSKSGLTSSTVKISVEYLVSASVSTRHLPQSTIQDDQPFHVNPSPVLMPLSIPIGSSDFRNLHLFYCVNRGKCTLGASIDKDACVAGETVTVHFDVDNRFSAEAVTSIEIRLVQEIRFNNKNGTFLRDSKAISRAVRSEVLPGVAARGQIKSSFALKVASDEAVIEANEVHPTTTVGTNLLGLISCSVSVVCRFARFRALQAGAPLTVLHRNTIKQDPKKRNTEVSGIKLSIEEEAGFDLEARKASWRRG